MTGWWTVAATGLLAIVIYFAFFWRINWVRDLRGRAGSNKLGAYVVPKNRKIGKLPPVYPNGWFGLMESSQLKRGQVRHVAALGENFAVFRSEKGVVSILDAYCPHLGANMGEGGKVRGDCLECPFHGWLFRGEDGRCQSIPYAEKVPEIAKTRAWDSCEVNQLIFVWYHAESAEPEWRPEPLEEISNGNWRYQGRNEFLVNSHIQEIPENGADWAHLSAVHGPAMFFSETLPWLARHSWTAAAWAPRETSAPETAVKTTQSNETSTLSQNGTGNEPKKYIEKNDKHRATMRLRHSLVLLEKISIIQLNVKAEQIGPGYVELLVDTALGPMCILQTVTPVEPLLQRVTHLMFAPVLLAPYASLVFLGESIMFERDVAVWNHKKFERRPLLVREDRTILAYRRWYSQFYSPRSPTYHSATRSLRW
ncbi:cholesterol 7-desaturase [Cephus cinctus]|uniref:cholesterol 7-desaturase n=1 Tax=Cephus cinctus TaxID=211228 RepID=A0AAJ7C3B2_CEPCN|nr:cholesterol 7-desaturase [Cephus cinctus]XP_024943569.1 cholesterol 7-desaturase [Cephus cinctus]XP_024943570.1 cholesterol 7-desaturase [Cephus cinctus]XP_024943571.1 cholesterol 7-desaturase [Cephus cinctus]